MRTRMDEGAMVMVLTMVMVVMMVMVMDEGEVLGWE